MFRESGLTVVAYEFDLQGLIKIWGWCVRSPDARPSLNLPEFSMPQQAFVKRARHA